MKYPGDLQFRNILAVDLREGRVTHPAGIVPVVGPFRIRGPLSACGHARECHPCKDQKYEYALRTVTVAHGHIFSLKSSSKATRDTLQPKPRICRRIAVELRARRSQLLNCRRIPAQP